MEDLIDLITDLFSTRWEFILSVLMMAAGLIILLCSAEIFLIIVAGLLILGGIVLCIRGFRRE